MRTRDDDALEVERILMSAGAVDAQTRGHDYRAAGWTHYDPQAQPYSREMVERERERHRVHGGEPRTFAAEGAFEDPARDREDRGPGEGRPADAPPPAV